MRLPWLKVLSEQEVLDIHNASLDILQRCGVRILNDRMLAFLKQKGLAVNDEARTVTFTRSSIEDALSHVPAQFEVFDRNGKFAYLLGDRKPKIAAGHNAVFWVDSRTGRRRESTVADVELFTRICDRLECIDMVGVPVMPQDIPDPGATLLYAVRAVIENTTKPIYFSTNTTEVNSLCIEMLRAAFEGDLHSQVYGISQLSSTSPLYWEEGVLDAIMDTVATGVPIAILPEPIAGISAPYTLAGLLTMCNAECLSGLAMIQMLRPKTKVMYANSWTTCDMRTGAALVGSTETTVCRIAAAQLAHFYKVPSHTTAPNSDNHAHDEQNAWEKAMSQFCSVAAGHDLIVNCGMFAAGLTCSNEQLLMDEEMSAICHRIAAGVRVDEETIAKDLIIKTGPQNAAYLTADHTLKWLYSDEYVAPRLSVREQYGSWAARGEKDVYQLARDKVNDYAKSEPNKPSSSQMAKLAEILASFGKSATRTEDR
jgi:trimethylamine--corrinoid protein Co-methyltransferase